MMGIAKEFMALILAWLSKGAGQPQPTPKPSDILADVVAAKILTDIQLIENERRKFILPTIHVSDFMMLSWIVEGISVKSHFVCSSGAVTSVLSCSISIKEKAITISDQSQKVISQALHDGFKIKSAQKKAKDDADNEFNALDALTDIFNIGKDVS